MNYTNKTFGFPPYTKCKTRGLCKKGHMHRERNYFLVDNLKEERRSLIIRSFIQVRVLHETETDKITADSAFLLIQVEFSSINRSSHTDFVFVHFLIMSQAKEKEIKKFIRLNLIKPTCCNIRNQNQIATPT